MIAGVVLGVISVLQAGFNRKIAASIGLVPATVLNNAVLFAASLALLIWTKGPPSATGRLATAVAGGGGAMLLWLIPGLLGLSLVAGIPAAMARFGAAQVFIPLIASQLVVSLVWDVVVEGKEVGATGLVGAVFALVGALLVSIQQKG
jgi:transporter family-2 protein